MSFFHTFFTGRKQEHCLLCLLAFSSASGFAAPLLQFRDLRGPCSVSILPLTAWKVKHFGPPHKADQKLEKMVPHAFLQKLGPSMGTGDGGGDREETIITWE